MRIRATLTTCNSFKSLSTTLRSTSALLVLVWDMVSVLAGLMTISPSMVS